MENWSTTFLQNVIETLVKLRFCLHIIGVNFAFSRDFRKLCFQQNILSKPPIYTLFLLNF